MKDSQSWYVLGNAHMTNFFVHQEQATQELELALKAYMMAEKFIKEPNPDLYFNRATVLEYLEPSELLQVQRTCKLLYNDVIPQVFNRLKTW